MSQSIKTQCSNEPAIPQALLAASLASAKDAVFIIDSLSRIIYANAEAALNLGYSQSALCEMTVSDIDADLQPETWQRYWRYLGQHASSTFERMHRSETGRLIPVEIRASRITHEGKHFMLALVRDISARKAQENQDMLNAMQMRALVDNTPDAITRYDPQGRRIFVNNRKLEKLGVLPEEILGKTVIEFPGGKQYSDYHQKILGVIATGKPDFMEMQGQSSQGKVWHSHIRIVPELNRHGEVENVLAVERDITELVEYRERVYYLAYYDSLTNIPNRILFNDRFSQVVVESEWNKQKFGLMVLDLDHFKEVNDSLGHLVGDDLLCAAAERLEEAVRSYDTVARMGGDEFAILLPDIRKPDDLATIANKVVEAISKPFKLHEKELFISTSVGIAIYPNDGLEPETLFKNADAAMYHAKAQGRNNYQFYSQDLGTRASEYISVGAALRQALKNGEFELYYQPQIDLITGRLIGMEALIRWNHPSQGFLTPDKFIAVAEESGLIVEIGEWVLEQACKAIVELNAMRPQNKPLTMAINLSSRQFMYNDLLTTVQRILNQTACPPSYIKLEITESLLLEDSNEIIAILTAFKRMGITISIDDFCTGYSALSYLGQFPVSQVKIDRAFIQDVVIKRDKTELVNAIIRIAQALNLELVAEGVESEVQVDFLKSMGCGMAQGYHFGRPMMYEQMQSLNQIELDAAVIS